MTYSYRLYGLGVRSSTSIAGPEPAPELGDSPDIEFQTGSQPDWVREGLAQPGLEIARRGDPDHLDGPTFTLTVHGDTGCFDLTYSDGTRFVVSGDAGRVWGTFQPPLTPDDLATYLLGPVMGFLLRRRQCTCLHASAIQIAGGGVALVGDAGFGKSTTAAALALRGIPVFSEDIVPLEVSGGKFQIVPGYPRICLWPDSVEMLLGSKEALPLLTPVWEKRYLPLDGIRGKFANRKTPLEVIYLFGPRTASETAPRVEELRPKDALLELVQNTYMNWLLDRKQRAAEFDFLARMLETVQVRRIVPHADPKKLGALCDLILRDAEAAVTRR